MKLPVSENNTPIPLAPIGVALASTVDATVSSSTEITLNAATSWISVYAKSQDIYMKWGTADVTASNSDSIIPAGQIRDFVIPRQSGVTTLFTAVNFLEETAGAKLTVHEY